MLLRASVVEDLVIVSTSTGELVFSESGWNNNLDARDVLTAVCGQPTGAYWPYWENGVEWIASCLANCFELKRCHTSALAMRNKADLDYESSVSLMAAGSIGVTVIAKGFGTSEEVARRIVRFNILGENAE
jgi:hypothetical protein